MSVGYPSLLCAEKKARMFLADTCDTGGSTGEKRSEEEGRPFGVGNVVWIAPTWGQG